MPHAHPTAARTRVATPRLLILLLSLSLLVAACGGDDADDAADTGDDPDLEAADDPDLDADDDGAEEADAGEPITLEIIDNAVRGGKNATVAEWLLEDVIPAFEEQMADEGKDVTVELTETGVDDEDYKTQLALDLSVGEGPDIIGFDQFWVSEFAAAGYLEPLTDVVGAEVDEWDGWDAIPEAVGESLSIDGARYGVPFGTDGRVLFYRKDIFSEAGLDPEWQPESWEDVLDAARTLADHDPELTPLQLNAGTSMGEASAMQGFLPVLLGAGGELYDDGWSGDTEPMREMLELYQTIYVDEGLGDPDLQVLADGRDRSFEQFSDGTIPILLEGDYFWRAVVAPGEEGLFPMEDRDEVVGYAKVPAFGPGEGVNGQDFVSASGGSGRVLNPNTEHPEEAWALLSYIGSEEAVTAFVEREPRITARQDVNDIAIGDDPMLSFVSDEVLPITWYRPGFEEYPQVSEQLQLATENISSGRSDVDAAIAEYVRNLEGIVGADNVN